MVEKRTGVTPPALLNRPLLPPELRFALEAFYTLSASRPISGMGFPGPISISEYAAFCQVFEVQELDYRATLLNLIRRLDRAYLEIAEKKSKQGQNKNKKS